MLSYRHSFHAGNFADVLKHAVLALLLEALRRKETPFCYIDTHAGVGRYDLGSAEAEKTGEWRDGIGRLWELAEVPTALEPYLAAVQAMNDSGALRFYPGSPRVARHLLRPQDRMVLTELHPTDLPLLRQEFAGDRQVGIHHQDGYRGLKAFLPPPERRGLVLFDPAYEVKDEYEQVIDALLAAHRRWPTGMYALWYPVLSRAPLERMWQRLRESGVRKILRTELTVRTGGALGMHGSGVVMVNPPWQLDQQLETLLPWLRQQLGQDEGTATTLEWLVPE